MKRNMMRKNLYMSIWKSMGRYIAIVAIIALGAAMFVGLLMTKADMVATGQEYTEKQNMFDLRLVSTYGWDLEQVEDIAGLDGVVDAEGLIYQDLIVTLNDSTDELVYRFYNIPETVNQIVLLAGRMPESPDECLADGYRVDESIIGTTITVAQTNEEDALESVNYRTYTVVGYISSPLYMDMNRGTTSVGSGSIANYIMVPSEAFDVDYYTEVHVTIPGEHEIYSDEYNNAMDTAAELLEGQVEDLARERMLRLKEEAEEAYAEGLEEYQEGLKEFEEAREEVLQELEDAYNQLMEAEELIAENEKKLASGEQQLAAARRELAAGEEELAAGKAELESFKSTAYAGVNAAQSVLDSSFASLNSQIAEKENSIAAIDAELAAVNSEIAAIEAQFSDISSQMDSLESEISSLDRQISALETALSVAQMFPGINDALISQLEASIAEQTAQRNTLQGQLDNLKAQAAPYLAQLEAPKARRNELQEQKNTLESEKRLLDVAMEAVVAGQAELDNTRAQIDEQFISYEREIAAGEAQIADAKAQIASSQAQINSGKAQLEDAKTELEEGWKEYQEGRAEAERELADAEEELAKAWELLEDARAAIDDMGDVTVYVLDRNTNVGYNSLDSASDIVSGVSRVFPAFFLLVAALVCITTMTRMIDEERTQIGTLKALGYSNWKIISKYLIYAGSGAIIGCGFGVIVGSVIFPKILWEAYKIMLFIQDDIVLKFNWWLCAAVVGTYTAVMLLVTWYCCRRTLKEEPAELIRPKAPDAGKKILLEYLPFWERISFLNKVTIRNIFRYRQRLAMMMLGIGGCTALLVTGYGLRDSITNVVDYQFEEVTTYDMTVYFKDGQTEKEQAEFWEEISYDAENVMFYHQSSIELDVNDRTKEIYMIAVGEGVEPFIDLHSGEEQLELPGLNEALVSVGAAESMGIDVGDDILLRTSDMEILTLTVSGIYDNHVYNYVIVSPETIEAQWGAAPELQMAFVLVKDGHDAYELSAQITGMNDVMNVAVSEDLAGMVSNMMEALDLVVWVIVFCAGLLAAIVLYNLTNININERIREIATIKVLGFNARETAAYVFKENLSLSVIGSLLGLGLGYLLLLFVMSQIKIDMVWFKAVVMPVSYVWAFALTMLAACIVDFVFYFKLEKINMAEALKSVE